MTDEQIEAALAHIAEQKKAWPELWGDFHNYGTALRELRDTRAECERRQVRIDTLEAENARLRKALDAYSEDEMLHPRAAVDRLQAAYEQARTDYAAACAQLKGRDAEVARLRRGIVSALILLRNRHRSEVAPQADIVGEAMEDLSAALAAQPAPDARDVGERKEKS